MYKSIIFYMLNFEIETLKILKLNFRMNSNGNFHKIPKYNSLTFLKDSMDAIILPKIKK